METEKLLQSHSLKSYCTLSRALLVALLPNGLLVTKIEGIINHMHQQVLNNLSDVGFLNYYMINRIELDATESEHDVIR